MFKDYQAFAAYVAWRHAISTSCHWLLTLSCITCDLTAFNGIRDLSILINSFVYPVLFMFIHVFRCVLRLPEVQIGDVFSAIRLLQGAEELSSATCPQLAAKQASLCIPLAGQDDQIYDQMHACVRTQNTSRQDQTMFDTELSSQTSPLRSIHRLLHKMCQETIFNHESTLSRPQIDHDLAVSHS